MMAEKAFVDKEKLSEAVTALRQYIKKTLADGSTNDETKRNLIDCDGDDGIAANAIYLQVEMKKMLTNRMTYIKTIGSLPHPFENQLKDSHTDICLIVRDLDPKKSLPDEYVDYKLTQDHYYELLGEELNLPDSEIKEVICVLTMRELISCFKTYEAKSKLAKTYTLFLADKNLMNNKFKFLNMFLGKHFWMKSKKVPLPIDLSLKGDDLIAELQSKLNSVSFYFNGNGSSATSRVSSLTQKNKEIVKNLEFILTELRDEYASNIQTLRIKTMKSIAIPFYVDLGFKSDVERINYATQKAQESRDELSNFNNADVTVYPNGLCRISKRKGDGEEINEDDDKYLNSLETKWIKQSRGGGQQSRKRYFKKRKVLVANKL